LKKEQLAKARTQIGAQVQIDTAWPALSAALKAAAFKAFGLMAGIGKMPQAVFRSV